MRILSISELDSISGGLDEKDRFVEARAIAWEKDPNDAWVPTWKPDGTMWQDAWEGLTMGGYLIGYKHFQTISTLVMSYFRK